MYSPKIEKNLFFRIKTIKIATYASVSIFNRDFSSVLLIMSHMKIIGSVATAICMLDEERIQIVNKRTFESPKENRITRKSLRLAFARG